MIELVVFNTFQKLKFDQVLPLRNKLSKPQFVMDILCCIPPKGRILEWYKVTEVLNLHRYNFQHIIAIFSQCTTVYILENIDAYLT